jgi:hypothetical protein
MTELDVFERPDDLGPWRTGGLSDESTYPLGTQDLPATALEDEQRSAGRRQALACAKSGAFAGGSGECSWCLNAEVVGALLQGG